MWRAKVERHVDVDRLPKVPYGTTCGLRQVLGEHHEDSAGAAEVCEFVCVVIGHHTSQRMASVPCGYLEGLIDVVNREGHAVHAYVVGPSRVRLDRLGMDVFKELESTTTIWRLEHRDIGMVSIKSHGSIGPLAADRVTADKCQTEIREKAIAASMSRQQCPHSQR